MAKVLVIDDSERTRNLLRLLLAEMGHEALQAPDSFAALEILDKYQVDLILLDVNMPYKNGFSLLQTLRDSYRNRNISVMMLTVRNSKRDVERAIELDVNQYLVKPIEPQDFKMKVEQILTRATKGRPPLKVLIPESSDIATAKLVATDSATVSEVSELGFTVTSSMRLSLNQQIFFNSPLLLEIGIETSNMEVFSVTPIKDDVWVIKLMFLGLSHEEILALKNWLTLRSASADRPNT